MSSVQIEQKSYEMPPREGISIAHFLTVADIERSARYYEKVFGARILSLGDGNAPGYLQLANIWMILNVGGRPRPVTWSPLNPHFIRAERQPYLRSVLCTTSIIYPSGSRM